MKAYQPVPADRNADGGGPQVVVADGPERHSERRAADPPQQNRRWDEGHHNDVVEHGNELFRAELNPQKRQPRNVHSTPAEKVKRSALRAQQPEYGAVDEQGINDLAKRQG